MNLSDGAVLAVVSGAAAIAFELMRPGLLVPGIAGVAGLLGGLFFVCSHAAQPLYMSCGVLAACLLFVFENWSPVRWISGLGATLLAAFSLRFWSRATPALSVPVALIAGFALTYLFYRTKLSRQNKLAG